AARSSVLRAASASLKPSLASRRASEALRPEPAPTISAFSNWGAFMRSGLRGTGSRHAYACRRIVAQLVAQVAQRDAKDARRACAIARTVLEGLKNQPAL